MRLFGYLRLIPALLRLLVQVGWTLAGVGPSKWRARQAYRNALRRAGLPEPFIAELVADYDLSFGSLLRGGLSRFGVRRPRPKMVSRLDSSSRHRHSCSKHM